MAVALWQILQEAIFVILYSKILKNFSWAKNLDIPIFSVDYRLAPEHPFPEGLNDCWQVYCWILQHLSDFFCKI